ncbi:MAG: aconitate hydratase AcnA [Alphaproteobacteria bacterium]|nr:aconitate hydratase AcnA [Alphaproteobacteria bacterium]
MILTGQDSLGTRKNLNVEGKEYDYFSLKTAEEKIGDISRLPFTLKILLENLLRFEDGSTVTTDDIKALVGWLDKKSSTHEIAYRPARILMQDFTGVPAVVDLAAMRETMVNLGGDAQKINPLIPVDLIIDHSLMVDKFGSVEAFKYNVKREFERNTERYSFLRWGQQAFKNFTVVPPGTGICHQVNVEYLTQSVWTDEDENNSGHDIAYPDTLVGTDSHTTMANALGVLGWGVGGIEAEAAMLGQPISMLIPEVVGFKLTGKLQEGIMATDLVLNIVEQLRELGVVGKFVEFYGSGLDNLSSSDRATISNMAPEYGATCGFFPVDDEILRYLKFTGRSPERVKLVEAYAKEQGLWRNDDIEASFSETLELDLGTIETSISGPKRPQDRIALSNAKDAFKRLVPEEKSVSVSGTDYKLSHGDIIIAAIASCTNTSNPYVLMAAGLVARKAVEKGLSVKPWVKTSLSPGSQVVSDYLEKAGLQKDLDALGFNLVGYGCASCIGNSGPLAAPLIEAIDTENLTVTSVISGNRNFEGRISPHAKANYLVSPPLVVAYAIAGTMKKDLYNEPLGQDQQGNDVYMKDIWPSNQEIQKTVDECVTSEMFKNRYADVFKGTEEWQAITGSDSETYSWEEDSTYIRNPPFFTGMGMDVESLSNIKSARAIAILGDSVTTDHISPAGAIKADSPAGDYLTEQGISPDDFNSYGSRRGNDEVMTRGTLANIRIRNEMVAGTEGGYTKHMPDGEEMSIYEASKKYMNESVPLVVIAGKEYGTGSSRDWAAKGTRLLGIKAAIVESFERIHRSNLIGMGVLPLQFKEGQGRKSLNLCGDETFDITGIDENLKPRQDVTLTINYADGSSQEVAVQCRIDTQDELEYYRNGGILHYVLRSMNKK